MKNSLTLHSIEISKRSQERRGRTQSRTTKVFFILIPGNSNSDSVVGCDVFDDNIVFDRLPENPGQLKDLLGDVKQKLKYYKSLFLK